MSDDLSFWYLATPYTLFKYGVYEAAIQAATNHALLVEAGIVAYSPIVSSHFVAVYGNLDPLDWKMWMHMQKPFLRMSKGIIMLQLEGWQQSKGMAQELSETAIMCKPIVWMTPGVLPDELRTQTETK